MSICPRSGSTGKAVGRVTLESLLRPEFRDEIGTGPWYYCPDPECDVVYFDPGGRTWEKEALSVRVGIKEKTPPRPVCYCFDFTAEEIEAEVAETGRSTIPDTIKERCKQGLDDCEHTNPKGRCCLGDVRAVMRAAQAQSSEAPAEEEGDGDDCCAPASCDEPGASAKRPTGRLATVGAVVTAALSSACCWLPLLLLTFGVSTAGLSAFFERYRPLFLSLSAILLATGFFLVYGRRSTCSDTQACSTRDAKSNRRSKILLWVATAFVLALALFPRYVDLLMKRAG